MRPDFTDDDFDDEYAEEALFDNEPDMYPGRRQQRHVDYGGEPHQYYVAGNRLYNS